MVIGMGVSILIAEGGRVLPPSYFYRRILFPAGKFKCEFLYTPFFEDKQMVGLTVKMPAAVFLFDISLTEN